MYKACPPHRDPCANSTTRAPIVKDRLRTFTACASGTSAVSGKYTYRARGLDSCGLGVVMISSADRSSSGNAALSPASANHRLTSSRTFSGCSAARSCTSERSVSVWYSSQVSSLKLLQPLSVGCVVTAFQPSCQIPREPSIEKNWVLRADGAEAISTL